MGKEEWIRELRHIYGAGILFFYYAKWPILLGLPALYYGLDYPHNLALDILWIWSLALVFKDLYLLLILKKSYCGTESCNNKKESEDASDNGENKDR
ncbi:hypothetical protein NNO_0567 [Hydrogenimonas sp.]|nr:hypothetical protein NNO_0567 [Hydrogenimonas sp.]